MGVSLQIHSMTESVQYDTLHVLRYQTASLVHTGISSKTCAFISILAGCFFMVALSHNTSSINSTSHDITLFKFQPTLMSTDVHSCYVIGITFTITLHHISHQLPRSPICFLTFNNPHQPHSADRSCLESCIGVKIPPCDKATRP